MLSGASSTAFGQNPPAADVRLRASVAMPVVANVMQAKLGLFALDAPLNVAGQASGTVPLLRYEYLRDKAKQTIAHIQQIESRMLPIQFALDDFAEETSAIRLPLAELEAELEAVKQRGNELVTQLAALTQAKKAVDQTIIALEPAIEGCDCDWWCWALAVYMDLLVIAGAVALLLALAAVVPADLAVLAGLDIGTGLELLLPYLTHAIVDCEGFTTVGRSLKSAQQGLEHGINENQAELTHALALRDILIARINALQAELEKNQSNAARTGRANSDLIQTQYNPPVAADAGPGGPRSRTLQLRAILRSTRSATFTSTRTQGLHRR